jgi:arylsulfatase A-like enzyme
MAIQEPNRGVSRRALLGASALAAPTILRGAARKRNVLFLAADDLCNRISCYGVPIIQTPHIDRLARSGVRFDRDYCQYPLCAPSRTSLMTGLAPDTTRVWGNNTHFRSTIPKVLTIPQAFQKNGYFTARAGKIYHYNNPSEIGTPGLDDEASWLETSNPAGLDRIHDEALVTYLTPRNNPGGRGGFGGPTAAGRSGGGRAQPGEAGGRRGPAAPVADAAGKVPWALGGRGPSGIRIAQDGRTPILPLSPNGDLGVAVAEHASESPDQSITDYMVAESVIAMMEEHRDEPWFLAAGFFRPHVPFIVPSKYFDLYSPDDMQVPALDPNELTFAPRVAYTTMNPNNGMTPQQHREAMRAYYAATSFVDAQVGRLLDALDRLNLAGNTTVVLWADHGWMLGEHGQWQKTMLFEPSARVPLIIAGAGVGAAGQGCPRTVEHLDLYPTLVDLCELKGAPSNLQGRSLAPLLAGPNTPWDHPALSQVTRRTSSGAPLMGYSIRTERYRYTTWGPEGEELYDYDNDPREVHNLAADPNSTGVKARLRTRLEQIARSRGMANAPGANAG